MVLHAGEVFPEWYWGPLFFLVVFSPVLLAAVAGTDVVVRRLRGPLPLWKRARLWLAAAMVAIGAILIVMAVRDHLRFEGESRAAAASISFAVLRPTESLADLDETRVLAQDGRIPHVVSHYESPEARAYAYEQEPTEVSLRPGDCRVYDIEGISSHSFEGPCEALRTKSGRAVFTGPSDGTVDGRDAFALLDGTLVRLISVNVSERDVLAWFDSLRPIDVEDIDFKGG